MSKYFGLIDPAGQILAKKGRFKVITTFLPRYFIIEFEQEMRNAVVLATARFFKENFRFDHECSPVVVSNAPDGNPNTLGFSVCKNNHEDLGFSFNIYMRDK